MKQKKERTKNGLALYNFNGFCKWVFQKIPKSRAQEIKIINIPRIFFKAVYNKKEQTLGNLRLIKCFT